MTNIFFYLTLILYAAAPLCVQAQTESRIRLAPILAQFPRPLPTLRETAEAYEDGARRDAALKGAGEAIQESLRHLYAPLPALLEKHCAQMSKAGQAVFSKEEQLLLKGFLSGKRGELDGDLLTTVMVMMESYHAVPTIGKLSWTSLDARASESAQRIFQQLKQIEAQFDWKEFAKQAQYHRPKFGESDDKKSLALFRQFEENLAKLPKKKVEEWAGIAVDVEDPDGAIALLRQYKVDSEGSGEEFYQKRYHWWMAQSRRLAALCETLDSAAMQAWVLRGSEGRELLQGPIADLQARILEACQKLNEVTHGIIAEAIVAASARLQIDQSIMMYQAFKAKAN